MKMATSVGRSVVLRTACAVALVAVGATSLLACKRRTSNNNTAPPAAVEGVLNAAWSTNAIPYRGKIGTMVTVVCPPGGPPSTIWGSDVYSDDSSVCGAALHSGRISAAAGGTFQIQVLPGQQAYLATTRNGVTTRPFGRYAGSFSLVGGPAPGLMAGPAGMGMGAPPPVVGMQAPPPVVGMGAPPPVVGMQGMGGPATTFAWTDSATRFRGQNGLAVRGFCPPGGQAGTVWGTGVYTDDSSICGAAMHAGRITAAGGAFTLRILPGMPRYTGMAANGIVTQNYGVYPGSFSVQP